MTFDFDNVINRKNTNSLKYDFTSKYGLPDDVLPLWVADMDFQTPPEVSSVLSEYAQHGIFGYSEVGRDYTDALHNWFNKRFSWDFHDSWLVKTPGVVYAIATAVRALTKKGDAVIIQQPVYYPFSKIVRDNQRKLVINSLVYDKTVSDLENGYRIDFADFEKQIIDNNVKMFIFCNPHNPVGRVWREDELKKLGDICSRHNVIVIADEIHADFVYSGHKHLIFNQINPECSDLTVLCTAPSKTFNLAGLQAANIFISNPKLQKEFRKEMNRSGYSQLNIMGLVACQAAYQYGESWLNQLLIYLEGNIKLLEDFLKNSQPDLKLVNPEGTYLAWIDFSAFMPNDKKRKDFINNKAKLWLDDGTMFGQEGSGFERINIACPRTTLKKALDQLNLAMKSEQIP